MCLFIIAISGCTSLNPVENNTFSKGGITFQYPGTWKENITFNYTSAPTENNTILELWEITQLQFQYLQQI